MSERTYTKDPDSIRGAIEAILAKSPGLTARRLVAALVALGHAVDKSQVNGALYRYGLFRPDAAVPPRWFLTEAPQFEGTSAPHRLLALHVENWKTFADATAIFAGVTLIYGENSSGKSSLFQALLLMGQSWGHGDLQLEGPLASFGWYEHVVHRHNLERDMSFTAFWGAAGTDDNWSVRLDVPHGTEDQAYEPEHPIERIVCTSPGYEVLLINAGSIRRPDLASDADWLAIPASQLADVASSPETLAGRILVVGSDARRFPDVDGAARVIDAPNSHDARSVSKTLRTVKTVLEGATAMLDAVEHIAPARTVPHRTISLRWARANAEYLARLFEHSDLLLDVNEWLPRFDVPYQLQISRNGDDDGDEIFALDLRREGGGERVQLTDVGFGVSQLLPIVVQLLGSRQKTILIEEPEAHLHPRLQSVLGDLFMTSAQDYGNVLVVETHSEPILLRLQRRIAEHRLDHDDLAVLHVTRNGESSEVEPVPIHQNGQLDYKWPGGFFDDRMDDLIAILDPHPDD